MANGTAFMLQGLQQHTLIAGKTTILRMFVDGAVLAATDHVEALVDRPGGSKLTLSWPKNQYNVVPQSSKGASIVVPIPGAILKWVGDYTVNARVFAGDGTQLASYLLNNVSLLKTKDLRIMVSRVWSGTPTKPGELDAARSAMQRLSAVYPLRDGVSSLDGDYTAGLRYNLDDNPAAPPNQDANLGPLWDAWTNRPPGADSIDRAIAYRFPNDSSLPPPFAAPDEPPPGAGASTQPPHKGLKWSLIVWKAPFAGVFGQETGHSFGLEPPQDPHRDPGGQGVHSRDVTIAPADAELGIDPQPNQPFPTPTYDLMYADGPSPGYPDLSISLNSWDWEYLRTQLAQLPSTGPTDDPLRIDRLTQLPGVVAVGGYYAKDDQAQHVIVATQDRTLTEVYWKPAQGVHQDVLTQFGNGVLAIAGYYAEDDDTQHAIVATNDGTLTEVYWKPAQGVHRDVLTQFGNGVLAIAGYYAKDDQAQHVIVATQDRTLTEVYWKPAQGVHQDVLTQFDNDIVGVGGYYAEDDDTQHAIVATNDGTLTEVYWKPAQGVHRDVLTQFGNGVLAIAGYYAKDDQAQHVIVATQDRTLTEVYWKPAQGVHQDVLTQFDSDIVGVGGYYAEDDDTQHAIVATNDGTLTELYWKGS